MVNYQGGSLKVARAYNRDVDRNCLGARGFRLGSMVNFISADGRNLALFFVLKSAGGENLSVEQTLYLSREVVFSNSGVPVYILWSRSGYVDQDIMNKVMQQFRVVWKTFCTRLPDSVKDKNSLECFVLSDQLKVHHEKTLRLALYNDRIHMWPLVAHSSYFDQPLDDLPYALARKSFNLEAEELTLAALATGHEWKDTLVDLMREIVEKRFTATVIQKAFEHTHLWPWRKDEFLARGKRLCGDAAGREGGGMEEFFTDFDKAVHLLREDDMETVEAAHDGKVEIRVRGAQLATIYDPRDLFLLDHWTRGDSEEEESSSDGDEAGSPKTRKKMRVEQVAAGHRKCKGESCKKKFCRGKGWLVCKCNAYVLCDSCYRNEKDLSEFVHHVKTHDKKKRFTFSLPSLFFFTHSIRERI